MREYRKSRRVRRVGAPNRTRGARRAALAFILGGQVLSLVVSAPAYACHEGGSQADVCIYDQLSGCHVLWIERQIHYDIVQSDGLDCVL